MPNKQEKLNKLLKFKKNPELHTFQSLEELGSKIKNLEGMKEEIMTEQSKAMESLQNDVEEIKKKETDIEIDREELRGEQGYKGDTGNKGENYVLTAKDKKEIASSIKVPVVKKVIEKTQVVREQPIVTENITNEIKEVAKYEEPEAIAEKLNTLKEKVDIDVIKGLKKEINSLKRVIATKKSGGGMGDPQHEQFSVGSATTTVTLSYNVAASGNAIWLYYQGQFLVKDTHYTVSGKIITFLETFVDSTFVDVTYIR